MQVRSVGHTGDEIKAQFLGPLPRYASLQLRILIGDLHVSTHLMLRCGTSLFKISVFDSAMPVLLNLGVPLDNSPESSVKSP